MCIKPLALHACGRKETNKRTHDHCGEQGTKLETHPTGAKSHNDASLKLMAKRKDVVFDTVYRSRITHLMLYYCTNGEGELVT